MQHPNCVLFPDKTAIGSLTPLQQVTTHFKPMVELVISQQHFKPLRLQKQSGFLRYKPFYSLSGSCIAMCWLKLAVAAVSLCQRHCGLPIPFGGELWLYGSQTSLFDTVCACTALLFWFNTTMPPISHSASSPFTFYLYHSACLPPSLFFFSLSLSVPTRTRAGPAAQ